ncbi:MAG: M20/M25/M40 family metallo-hydrolase, partial [Pyrinomonadaceae bacterium]
AMPVGFSPNGEVSKANIVFAGYGIVSKDPVFDDYGDNDVRGKVVMVLDGTPDNDNPHTPFYRFDARTKALIAKDKGAVGLLLISRETKFTDDKLTRLGYDQSLGEAALPTFVISRETAARILKINPLELPVTESMVELKANTSAKVTVTLRNAELTISFQVNLLKKQADAFNVIGILPGTDPTLKNEAIVIGAHYDHLGHGGQGSLAANSTEIHHGADDNASGTAAVIELARQFAKSHSNKRTLIFMCFSGEEEGLLGSNYYVNNPVWPLDKTIAMINMDMVGRLKDDKLTIGGIGTTSEWPALVNAENKLPLTVSGGLGNKEQWSYAAETPLFKLQLNEDGFGPSDHSSFYGKKIPVLYFFTGTHSDYHKPSDTADKINYRGEASIIFYIGEILRSIDQNPQRPTYTVAKSSMGGGRSGFNISLGTIPNYADATDGLLLDGVRDDSPAAKAGVKAGDKVVKLAGHDVRNVMDYTYILGEMKAGEEYEIVVLRGGERLTLKIIPVKR